MKSAGGLSMLSEIWQYCNESRYKILLLQRLLSSWFSISEKREICWPEQEREIKDGKRFCLLDDLTWAEGDVCTSSLGQGKLRGFVHLFVWVILRVGKNQSQTTCLQLKKPVSSALGISELYEFWPTTLSSYNKPHSRHYPDDVLRVPATTVRDSLTCLLLPSKGKQLLPEGESYHSKMVTYF